MPHCLSFIPVTPKTQPAEEEEPEEPEEDDSDEEPDYTFGKISARPLPVAPREAFGHPLWTAAPDQVPWWRSIPLCRREGVDAELPMEVLALRSIPLPLRVHPLLFMCGPWSAWTAHGSLQSRANGAATADISRLEPAPLGFYFDPLVVPAAKPKQQFHVETSADAPLSRLPTLPMNMGGLPPGLRPVKMPNPSGKKGIYFCPFPRCTMPAVAVCHGNQNCAGVVRHILHDHLGLYVMCERCGHEVAPDKSSHAGHSCRGPSSQPKFPSDPMFFAFVFPVEWELWGRVARCLDCGERADVCSHSRRGDPSRLPPLEAA